MIFMCKMTVCKCLSSTVHRGKDRHLPLNVQPKLTFLSGL